MRMMRKFILLSSETLLIRKSMNKIEEFFVQQNSEREIKPQ